ncbi:hypothetical protein HKM21_02405 [Longimicrobium terrae]|nr:hypothetical protein [Longimicrobium terrae]
MLLSVIEPVFEVFARKGRGEPLRHIGFVNAMTGDLARVYAWKTYDEQNWDEMCVVPRSAILPVDPDESQFVTRMGGHAEQALVHTKATASYGGAEVVKENA